MICVKFDNKKEYFDSYRQAKRFCFYELANEGYELFLTNKHSKGGNRADKTRRFTRIITQSI